MQWGTTTTTPVRIAIINKSTNNECWRWYGEKDILLHCWWECKLVQQLQKTVWMYLRKLNIELPYDPAIPLLGIYPDKTLIEKDTCVFIAALFTIAKAWKQHKCPLTDEWNKMWYIYTVEYYSAIIKQTNAICSNMDGSRDFHTKWSKPERKRQIMTSAQWKMIELIMMSYKYTYRCRNMFTFSCIKKLY